MNRRQTLRAGASLLGLLAAAPIRWPAALLGRRHRSGGGGASASARCAAGLLGRGRDGGRLARSLRGSRGHLLSGGLQFGRRGRDHSNDASHRTLEAVGKLDHGAAALDRGSLVRHALELGLLGGLARDEGFDPLDRAGDGTDLVAAAGLGDIGLDLATAPAASGCSPDGGR